jgi:hypothetical protein
MSPTPRIFCLIQVCATDVVHIQLKCPQGCSVSNNPGADIENSSSSSWSEFEGFAIAQAGGAGGIGHIAATGTATPGDTQPASTIGNSTAQSLIFSEVMCFLPGSLSVDVVSDLLGDLLLFQCGAHLGGGCIADGSQIILV